MPIPPALIFDLDGTLTDSKPGILGCLREVLDARNLGDPGPLDRFIGPPVEQWATELLPDAGPEDQLALAQDYRACYDRTGWKINSVFDGVRPMLLDLRHQAFPLFLCTSKRSDFALRILDHFELTAFFQAIYADQSHFASHNKADLLASLLREQSLNPADCWMIGDRIFDIQAARANRVRSLFAAWGYGPPQEGHQADAVAAHPADIANLVRSPMPIATPN